MSWRGAIMGLALLGAGAIGASPAPALEPDEVLPDPALEARARDISRGLRCVVCRNQSIDDSDAGIAGDMRVLVRERLLAGDTDAQVRDYLVERYGEFVLMRPVLAPHTVALWLAPGLFLLGGALVLIRRRSGVRAMADGAALSADEERELERVLGAPDDPAGR